MTKKQAGKKKTSKKQPTKSTSSEAGALKTTANIVSLLLIIFSVGYIFYILWPSPKERPVQTESPKPQKKTQKETPKPKIPAQKETPKRQKLPFEIYPKDNGIPTPEKAIEVLGKPKVALIIDDLGYDKRIAKRFIQLNASLTLAILPNSPHRKSIAISAHQQGKEVMLHLPMEPVEYPRIDPGPGALLTSMPPDVLIAQLNQSISSVPFIKGVNNHMGSKMTTVSRQLYQIFSILKKRNLYFVDSRTTSESLCTPSARMFQISYAERDVFIDNVQEPKALRKQFDKLIKIAKIRGKAVGIGHPYPVTIDVLSDILPKMKTHVQIVSASQIVGILD